MKIRIRMLCVLLTFLCLIGIPLQVHADLIYFPLDPFYELYYENCFTIKREYTADGPDGTATVYKSPESDQIVAEIENGEVLYIYYGYLDAQNVSWGLYENGSEDYTGWLPMNQLTVVYDAIAFMEDHGEDLLEEKGFLTDVYGQPTAIFHDYPGSPDYYEMTIENWTNGNEPVTYSKAYVDEKGAKWVMVDKYYHIQEDAWVQITGETEPKPTPEPMEEPTAVPSTAGAEHPFQPSRTILFTVLGIAALAGVSYVLLVLLKRKK